MWKTGGHGLKTKRLPVSIAVLTIPLLVLTATLQGSLGGRQISLDREGQASHVLMVALDSRGTSDSGLPDSLVLLDLDGGSIESIPRDWSKSLIAPSKSIVDYHLDIQMCEPFCSIQGVYAFAKLNQSGSSGEANALKKLGEVVSREYGIPNLGIIVFDLNWAYSFLHRIGDVSLRISQPIPVGGRDANGIYLDVERYIEPGYRLLSGDDLYWYARARHGSSNESRMERQLAVVSGISKQKNFLTIALAAIQAVGYAKTDLDAVEITKLLIAIPRIQPNS